MFLTTGVTPVADCFALHTSSNIFLSFLVILLVCNLLGIIGYKIRTYRREKSQKEARKIAIGRAKDALNEKLKVHRSCNNNIGTDFRSLHDVNNCPVEIPSFKIIRDTYATSTSSQDGLYARIDRKKREAAVTSLNLPLTAISKPSGEYTELLDLSQQKNGTSDNYHRELKHFVSSTPVILGPDHKPNQAVQKLFCISPVTSRRGKASTLQTDTSNAFVSEENQQNFKSPAIYSFPHPKNSNLLKVGGGMRITCNNPLEYPEDGAYMSFHENKRA